MRQGNIVLLNGTSSAGKTSIARALQEIMETPYLHPGIDHFLPRLPQHCFVVADAADSPSSEYFLLVYKSAAGRTVAEHQGGVTVYGDGTLAEVRIGPGGVALLAGMYRGIAALAAAGVDVIVDDVIHHQTVLRAAVEALCESQVLFVGLRLPRSVAERRERERKRARGILRV
jgi:chloramphenicol 3-O phosphotransferase